MSERRQDPERYKKTELGKIPDEWKVVKIGEIAQVNMGQSPSSSTYNDNGEGLPFFQGNADFGSLFPQIRLYTSNPIKRAYPNEILMSVRAPVGALNYCNVECCIGRGLCSLKMIKGNNNFLFYLLKLKNKDLNSVSTGSTFTSINKQALNDLKITIPPLSEQYKIASILSKVDEQIEQTEQIVERTEILKKGLMQKLLTKGIGHTKFKKTELGEIPEEWECKKLSEISKTYSGGTPLKSKAEYFGGDIPWVKSGELNKGLIFTTEECISEQGLNNSSAKWVTENSILIAMYGATAGKVGLLKIRATINQAILAVIPKVETHYLFLYYSMHYLMPNIVKTQTQGSGQPNLNAEIIKNNYIPLPSFPEQQKIASILSKVDSQIQDNQSYLTRLRELKKGLMQDLLTGKVRVCA